ncbi:MAG: ribosome silencing factor [candidate division WOR-3 bacterium]|nr:ribosome silencing factor [candidate division WOR-3 bacterium]
MVSNDDLINTVVQTIKEKKASDIVKLKVGEVTEITDSFIICTSQSDVHSRALADAILEELENKGVSAHHLEGYELGRWVLLDYLDFVIHIFLPKQRAYYGLERLWGDVPKEEYSDEKQD